MQNDFDSQDARSHERRRFIQQATLSLGSLAITTPFQSLLAAAPEHRASAGFGELRPVKDNSTGLELLKLPEGFQYSTFGWTGDPMNDGNLTPGNHDGMAVVAEISPGKIVLCRNHERNGNGRSIASDKLSFDKNAPGGCTNLLFDADEGQLQRSWCSLSGTANNCAGGPTPWGTWLSCEETVLGPGDDHKGDRINFQDPHGWIFEVPAEGISRPVPLKEMGRFVHEAVAIDPATGIVYETEDRQTAGFYRFTPNTPGKLVNGGKLQMMKLPQRKDVRSGVRVDQVFDVQWVDIDDPLQAHSPGTKDALGVYSQGKQRGGVTFARLEGCWAGRDGIYIVSTNGGDAGVGQVWEYIPAQEQLRLLFESPSPKVLENPDNITVSPRGGLVLCEDGDQRPQRLHGLTPGGDLFPFAANNIVLNGEIKGIKGDFRDQEWAGATFSPDGKWLFVNNQTPGVTFAITGPWADELI
ncbi:protein containing DUF839, bacterial [Rhodopirellula maiorica SM1]|uniref:Protein containing DUF839, bacterial n=1 Tax=Rhodopirellula maiorica SM1 TaxID=1265738 RepID=M5RHN7_9BACT|nr:alkaline phosphatase PhoX [Rhodopirellula maiorica]EMI18795.1 protein containing DUF839, bacterial [Rhodopirellula maiorica SM1]